MPKSGFKAQQKTIQKALANVMKDMQVKNYKVVQEDDKKVTIMFVLKGVDGQLREYRYVSDFFSDFLGNYRAAQLAISRLWAIYNEWHIRAEDSKASLETILKGFRTLESRQVLLALPDPENRKPWEVLGVSSDATIENIEKAFREKVKTIHPDVGGSNDEMSRLNNARKEMQEALK